MQELKRSKKSIDKPLKENDAANALHNDDIKNREYENVALQAQRHVYQAQLEKCQDQIRDLIINLMFLVQMIPVKITLL